MAAGTRTRYRGLRAHNAEPPRRLDQATYRDLGVKPFTFYCCDLCKAGLHDRVGNPRWEMLDGRFVCTERCRALT